MGNFDISNRSVNMVKFTKKNIEAAKRFVKNNYVDLPDTPNFATRWLGHLTVRNNKLYIDSKEIVPSEERDKIMRDFILKKDSDIPFGMNSGFNAISKKYAGISSRDWNNFLRKQRPIRETDARKPQIQKGGISSKQLGDIEIDLIEMAKRDLPREWKLKKDFYLYSAVDRATGLTFIRYAAQKTQKTIRKLVIDSFKYFAEIFRIKINQLVYTSDAGDEFYSKSRSSPDNPFTKYKVQHNVVRKGASIESRNRYIQSVYHRLVRLKRGNSHSIVTQTQKIVNNTRNRHHKYKTPLELTQDIVGVVLNRFNKTRSKRVPEIDQTLQKGSKVRILIARRDKDSKIGFKSYKGKSYSKKLYTIEGITKKQPFRYRVTYQGKKQWFTQDNIISTKDYDKITDKMLEKKSSYGKAKEKNTNKKRDYRINPRRSARLNKKK